MPRRSAGRASPLTVSPNRASRSVPVPARPNAPLCSGIQHDSGPRPHSWMREELSCMNCVTCRVSWFRVSSVADYAVEPTGSNCVTHRGRSALSRIRHSLPPAPEQRLECPDEGNHAQHYTAYPDDASVLHSPDRRFRGGHRPNPLHRLI